MDKLQPNEQETPVSIARAAHQRELLESIQILKQTLSPLRHRDHEINYLVQELAWLTTVVTHYSPDLMHRELWLCRAIREGTFAGIPGADEMARKVMAMLPSAGTGPEGAPSGNMPGGSRDLSHETDKEVRFKLRLFIAGNTRSSRLALQNLEVIMKVLGECEYRVIDVIEDPESAEGERIIATPTLIRDYPLPRRKVIGDLSDIQTVLLILT